MQQRKTIRATVGESLFYLLPRLEQDPAPPIWPPDVFGLCMALLLKSGAYSSVLATWPPSESKELSSAESWTEKVAQVGGSWQAAWTKREVPAEVGAAWKTVMGSLQVPICELCQATALAQSLLNLCAFSDEASGNIGVPHEEPTENAEFYSHADLLLEPNDYGSTLCEEIDQTRIRVLPKMRTPQSGLTIRSFSHNLSFCGESEVRPKWFTVPSFSPEGLCLNLLIVPWPMRIDPSQFCPTEPLKSEMQNLPGDFGFFTFVHKKEEVEEVVRVVSRLYEAGVAKLGRIDGVILPEAAVSVDGHRALSKWVLEKEAFLITGVGEPSKAGIEHGTNMVHVDIPGMELLTQKKHHRWKLDGSQIAQYGLGGRLHPEKIWWEHISVTDRQIVFLSMLPWLVMCPLICEDLARPDPIGDVIRAVGPNLIVALLMDGPQIKERWGARYATTLADDPGSSVLSITSLGMAGLSRALHSAVNRSRVIALWKDPQSGGATEIELPAGSDAVVISLTVRYLEEWTADGRSDGRNAGCPMLSGIHSVRLQI